MREKDPLLEFVHDFDAPEDARPADFLARWNDDALHVAWDESCDVEAMCGLLTSRCMGEVAELQKICEIVHTALARLSEELDQRIDSMLARVDQSKRNVDSLRKEILKAKEKIEEHRDAARAGDYARTFRMWFRGIGYYEDRAIQGELAILFRELVPHPPSIEELLRVQRQRREKWIREDSVRPKAPPLPTIPRRLELAEVFEKRMKLPLPFKLRPACVPISEYKHGAETWELLVGTRPAKEKQVLIVEELSLLEGLPPGYFMTGFWGHGVSSYAFYLCDVGVSRRVYFRLPYDNVYGNIAQERATVVAYLQRYVAFLNHARFHRLTLLDAMGSAGYELELEGGRIFKQQGSRLEWDELEEHAGLHHHHHK